MDTNIVMRNQTDFFLSGLSDISDLQLPLFLFFLLIYLLTIIWNLLIIVLIATDPHLHVPMYFFLGNLGSLDLCCSSVTIPRMLFDLHNKSRKITATDCITQVFFVIFFASSEAFLLSAMSYDRYTAICQPLHYIQIMNWKVCVQLSSTVWCLGFTYSFANTLCILRLSFCGSHIIESFFCDLPQLFHISCSDIYLNILLIFLVGGLIGGGTLMLTIMSYVYIFKTVLKIQTKSNRNKVYSTCTPHLTVVFMFYCSSAFTYFRPSPNQRFAADKVVSVFYTIIVPLLNPLIYSLRNKDFRTAFHKIFYRKICHLPPDIYNLP